MTELLDDSGQSAPPIGMGGSLPSSTAGSDTVLGGAVRQVASGGYSAIGMGGSLPSSIAGSDTAFGGAEAPTARGGAPAPGAETQRGNDKSVVSREELHKVIAQRDRFKEEVRGLKIMQRDAEKMREHLNSRLDRELQDKNLAVSRKEDLENRLAGVQDRYSNETKRLEDMLKQSQAGLDEAEKRINAYLKETAVAEEENLFTAAAKKAAFSDKSAEILFGYLRGKNRLRTAPVYADEAKKAVKGYRQEIECLVPDGTGQHVKRFLPLDEAMSYLKQEHKVLAPALAPGGGQGSVGSDGSFAPGVLNRRTLTVEEYIAARDPRTGKVFVR